MFGYICSFEQKNQIIIKFIYEHKKKKSKNNFIFILQGY